MDSDESFFLNTGVYKKIQFCEVFSAEVTSCDFFLADVIINGVQCCINATHGPDRFCKHTSRPARFKKNVL